MHRTMEASHSDQLVHARRLCIYVMAVRLQAFTIILIFIANWVCTRTGVVQRDVYGCYF